MVKIKVKSAASSWWAERSKILAEIRKAKPVRARAKPEKVKVNAKQKRLVAKKPVKAKKVKKANNTKKATKIKKTRKSK